MQSYQKIIFAFFISTFLSAETWSLWLNHLEIKSNTDFYGDEVYFFVLEKENDHPQAYTTLPIFPFSYTQENLPSFEPALLWQGNITSAEKSIVVSLVEREVLPWIADEILGNMEMTLDPQENGVAITWESLTDSLSFDKKQESPLSQAVFVEYMKGSYIFNLEWKKVQ